VLVLVDAHGRPPFDERARVSLHRGTHRRLIEIHNFDTPAARQLGQERGLSDGSWPCKAITGSSRIRSIATSRTRRAMMPEMDAMVVLTGHTFRGG
jgi:hypothetical protein